MSDDSIREYFAYDPVTGIITYDTEAEAAAVYKAAAERYFGEFAYHLSRAAP